MNSNWIFALIVSLAPLAAQQEPAPREGARAPEEWRQRFDEAQQRLQQAREGMQRLMQERGGERGQSLRERAPAPQGQRDGQRDARREPQQDERRGDGARNRAQRPDRSDRSDRNRGERQDRGDGDRRSGDRQGRSDGRRAQGPGARMQRGGAPMRGMTPMPGLRRGASGFGGATRAPMVERLQQMQRMRERVQTMRSRMGAGPRDGQPQRFARPPQGHGRGRA